MKNKQTTLQIILIAIICIFSIFLGGFYLKPNSENNDATLNMGSNSFVTSAKPNQANKIANQSKLVSPSNVELSKTIYVVMFKYTSDDEILDTTLESLSEDFTTKLFEISSNNFTNKMGKGSLSYTVFKDQTNQPVLLNVSMPNPLTKDSLYNVLTSELSTNNYTQPQNTMFVYVGNMQSFTQGTASELLQNLHNSYTGSNAIYYPEVSGLMVNTTPYKYSITHANLINAFYATNSDSTRLSASVENRAKGLIFKQALNFFGMPSTSYLTSTGNEFYGYSSNWDILSNAPYAAPYNNFYAWKLGFLDDDNVEFVKKTGTIEGVDTSSKKIYIIEPSASKYAGQAIIIQPFIHYDDSSLWSEYDSISVPNPNVSHGFIVARVNTMYKQGDATYTALNEDGSYKSATENFIPYYVFTPTGSDTENRDATSNLNNSYISNVGTSAKTIGNLEAKSSATFNTGYISLYNNQATGSANKYENSQLKITVSGTDNTNLTLKIECNNSEVLPPVEGSIAIKDIQDNTASGMFIDYDVRVLLYNIYVDYQLSHDDDNTFSSMYSGPSSNLYATTWNDINTNETRSAIYDKIHTLSPAFTTLTSLDLGGGKWFANNTNFSVNKCQELTSLQFLQEINFVNLQNLSICDFDLSTSNDSTSRLSLNYLSNLKNLKNLELNSDNLQDIDSFENLNNLNLEKISLINNNLTNVSALNTFSSSLNYANISHNQISNENLLAPYKGSTFYANSNIDVGLQRIPTSLINTNKTSFVFESWVTDSNVKSKSAKVVTYSEAFSNSGIQQLSHTTNVADVTVTEQQLKHGRYIVEQLVFISITNNNLERVIPVRYCNCLFLEFTYSEEEVCQTSNDVAYDYALNAYNSLNTLKNFSSSKFVKDGNNYPILKANGTITYPYKANGTPDTDHPQESINFKFAGKYLIKYKFLLTSDFKNYIDYNGNFELEVCKTLIVYPYTKITYNTEVTGANNIKDSNLYKALLVLAGKRTIPDVVYKPSSNEDKHDQILDYLGDDENHPEYTLYNQDFYFYKVTEKHKPSIASVRAETGYILNELDISGTVIAIYLKEHPSLKDATKIPKNEVLVNDIAGLSDMNLMSITKINLNSLGFVAIKDLFKAQVLPNIEVLNCANNKIENISGISSLTTLKYLDLSFNNLNNNYLTNGLDGLRTLTDPRMLSAVGKTTQTLRRVNLAFNNIDLTPDLTQNSALKYIPRTDDYGYCQGVSFVLEDYKPTETFLAQNQIYIVLVQCLIDCNVYSKTSKWQYFYTPAVETFETMYKTSKTHLYTIEITPSINGPVTFINSYSSNGSYSGYTNYSTSYGMYSIGLTFNKSNNTNDNLPFQNISKNLYYTVVTPSVQPLENAYSKFPKNTLFSDKKITNENSITYYILSTDYNEFLNEELYNQYKTKRYSYITNWKNNGHSLEELSNWLQTEFTLDEFVEYYKTSTDFKETLKSAGIVLQFAPNVTLATLSYGSVTYWNTYYGTNSDYWKNLNTTNASTLGTSDLLLPIQITINSYDYSQFSNLSERYVQFDFEFTFNRSNSFAGTRELDEYVFNKIALTKIETYTFTIKINIIHNPEINFSDENLEKAMRSVANKKANEKIYAYDFYNLDTLNLSNCNISTFAKDSDESFGFEYIMFNNLTKINLSHNELRNKEQTKDDTLDPTDPLYNLLNNTSIFMPENISGDFKYTYKLTLLDLSFNKIEYLKPFTGNNYFGKDGLSVNLFANKIKFSNSDNQEEIEYYLSTRNARVVIGIQGLTSEREFLISYRKEINSSNDTYAKFSFYQGNISPLSGFTLEAPGAYVEVVKNHAGEPLYYTYYYKDAYYLQPNNNYTVTYRANFSSDMIINYNATIVHQKMYINIEYDNNGNVVEGSDDKIVNIEFMSDTDDPEAYNNYINETLAKDVFTYENCSPADFATDENGLYSYRLTNSFGETELQANRLTNSRPYQQIYTIFHKASNQQTSLFAKHIYVLDTTGPTITTNKDLSQDKYIVTKGKNHPTYSGKNQLDSDIVAFDAYDNYYDNDLQIRVTIYKNGELLSDVHGSIKQKIEGFGIDTTEVGIYRIVYVATDSNGNSSTPYERVIEIYYQPYSWVRLSDFSASMTAGDVYVTATVYRAEDDYNKNTDPTFNWYVDGVYSHSTKKEPSLSNETTYITETTVFVQGAGTHSIEVYVDITKEEFEQNTLVSGFEGSGLTLSYKNTEVFILLDDNVSKWIVIGVIIAIVLIILLIVAIMVIRHKKELTRNTYEYTIEKHNRRK